MNPGRKEPVLWCLCGMVYGIQTLTDIGDSAVPQQNGENFIDDDYFVCGAFSADFSDDPDIPDGQD